MKTKLYTFLLSSLLCTDALADNEPWQNPQVNEMNREPMHAHFTPFTNEANALKQRALPCRRTVRRKSCNRTPHHAGRHLEIPFLKEQ